MTHWYYADGSRQRHGPLAADDLVELFRNGGIGADTPVWREGLPQWCRLADCATELGLPAVPPPLPAAPRPVPSTPAAAPPRRGLSGCMIALLVAAGLAIPVLAILAAIALPAYQDYTLRAKVSGAVIEATTLKSAAAEFQAEHETCASNGDGGFGAAEDYASSFIETAEFGSFESGNCGVQIRLRGIHADKIDGKALWFEQNPDNGEWACTSEIEDRYLPTQCRG